MLMNLHKHVWTEALQMEDFGDEGGRNGERLKRLVGLAEGYEKRVKEETELTKDQLKTRYVGKLDPKKRKLHQLFDGSNGALLTWEIIDLEDVGQQLIEDNIVSVSRQMIDKEASVAHANGENGNAKGTQQSGGMEVDEEEL